MSTATLNSEKIKTLVPKLRFQEFDGEWEKKALKEICAFFSGGTPTSTNKNLYNGNIPFIGSGNIYDSEVSNYITEEALNSSSAKIVKIGDLLYALYGANSGEVAISKMEGAINQAILCIRTNSENIEFIHYLLLYNKNKIVTKYLQGGQGNLSADIVKKLKYSFPSISEQQKITSFLSSVDEKIQQLTRKATLLEHYKKGVMQQLFSGKLRFKDENGKDYPDWEEKKLGEIGKIVTGKTPSTSDLNLWDGEIQFITPTDIKDGIKYQESTSRYVVKNDKLKILPINSIIYTCIASIGKMCISKFPSITNQQINTLIVNENHSFEYVYYWLFYLTPYIKTTQANTTLPIINKTDFSKFHISIPSLSEQQKIANFLSSIDSKIESVNQQLVQTQTFKKGLLQQMFV